MAHEDAVGGGGKYFTWDLSKSGCLFVGSLTSVVGEVNYLKNPARLIKKPPLTTPA